ncbi:hypothetical protein [Allochromatium tepidum]|nr:hypothetical protein [Allochromatium tepidum]
MMAESTNHRDRHGFFDSNFELDESDPSLMDWDWHAPGDVDFPATEMDSGENPVAEWHMDSADYFPVVDLGDEETYSCPPDLFSESFVAAIKNIPDPRKERAKELKQAKLAVVSYQDYDDPLQQKLVRLMNLRAQAILNNKPGAPNFLRWFFCMEKDDYGLDFEVCAIGLGADPSSVRLRFQSYMYLRWIVLNSPIGFLVAPPPEEMLSQSTYYGGQVGAIIMRHTWEWPGIPLQKLVEDVAKSGFGVKYIYNSIGALQEKKYLLDWNDNCYAVGSRGRLLDRNNPWRSRF